MHVAQFVHRYPPARGGAEAYAERLTNDLRAHGDSVDVWTTTAIQLEEFWTTSTANNARSAPGIRRYQPLTFPLRRYVLKALTMLPSPRLRSFVLPCNPISLAMWHDAGQYDGPLDAVHATAFPYAWPILCARRLSRRRNVPFLLTPFLHLGDERTRRQYTQPALAWLLRDADAVFVQTNLERNAVLELGVPHDRVILQGLGVDAAECTGGDRDGFRMRHHIADDEVVIGHLANLSVEKGSVDLLRACERLWQRGVKVRLVLAGSSMPNFRSFYDHVTVKDNVIVHGPLSDCDKRDFFAGIDIFALPSRSDSFGLVLLEAWANNVPNVAYRAGGPGEIIRHGRDGLLAECGSIEQLAGQLETLIRSGDLREQYGRAGQRRLRRDFDWSDKLAVVRQTLTNRAGRPSLSRRGCRRSVALHPTC